MNLAIDYKALHEAVRGQRDRLADSEAALTAAVKMLNAKVAQLQAESSMWEHTCTAERGVLQTACGEPCSWCGEKQ